jgi:N-acetylneuraminic acid mutarotase
MTIIVHLLYLIMVSSAAWSAEIPGGFAGSGGLQTPRAEHTATLLSSARVLVAGGENAGTPLASSEFFDPAAGTWTATTGTMNEARQHHTATLLPSGRVLVVCGLGAAGQASSTCEVYEPDAGTWSYTASSLVASLSDHTATLLSSGQVLVVGGSSGGAPTASGELYDYRSGTWTATAGSLSVARDHHTATLLPSGQVLVAGGYGAGAAATASCELFDPATGTWSATGSLAAARSLHTATLLANGKVLVVGGVDGSGIVPTCESYDPSTGRWTATAPLNDPRGQQASTLLPSGKVLVTGGIGSSDYTPNCELYDPIADAWTFSGTINPGVTAHTATLLPSGQILVAGGQNGGLPADAYPLETLDGSGLYDPGAGSWTATGAMANARNDCTATLLMTGKVLVAAGNNPGGGTQTSCELYDPATGTWSATGPLSVSRIDQTATMLPSGKVLVAGGFNTGGALQECELYDPSLGTWSVTGALATARSGHSATLLPTGQVLVAGGGNSGSAVLSSCELYDPVAGAWSSAATLNAARSDHMATLLPDGHVLVSGGLGSSAQLSSCELYDPSAGSWSITGSMATARQLHTATLLPSGQVLVAGGFSNASQYLNSCELFTPGTGAWSVTDPLTTARWVHTATLLPTGEVLVTGGDNGSGWIPNSEIYLPAIAAWSATGPLLTARADFIATLLPAGQVLVCGGDSPLGMIASSELYDRGLGFLPASQPVITAWPATLTNGSTLSLAGTLFTGLSEAASGGTASSASNVPLIQLMSGVNEQQLWLTYDPTSGFSSTAVTTQAVPPFPTGQAWLRIMTNGIPSQAQALTFTELSVPTITWPTPGAFVYGTPLSGSQLDATAGIAGTFTYSPPAGAILEAGSQTLSVTFVPTDAQHWAATMAIVTMSVTKAALSVTAANASRAYGAPNPLFTGTLAGAITGDAITATYASSATPTTPVGAYGPSTAQAITPTLIDPGGRLANYTVAVNRGTLSITATPLTVTAANARRAYGAPNPQFTGTLTGVIPGDAITATYASSATPTTPIGAYGPSAAQAITPTLIDPGGRLANYTATVNKGTLIITAITLTITADDLVRNAWLANPPLTATYAGFVNGDTIASLADPATLSTTATTKSPPGQYPITASDASAPAYYSIQYVPGVLTILDTGESHGANFFKCGGGSSVSALVGILLLALGMNVRRTRRDSPR